MPKGAKVVDRTSFYGNQFVVGKDGTAKECVEKYERYIKEWREKVGERIYHEWIDKLRGKDLVCWCPLDQSCHADVLLRMANE
jgi:hypothetical protein